ncbi:hypothetical protein J32TS6_10290 [Virgibacillus pantothenticus]|nr:hypothetical protein J32TS6_10290 [Virgibacillus pantothenticus]
MQVLQLIEDIKLFFANLYTRLAPLKYLPGPNPDATAQAYTATRVTGGLKKGRKITTKQAIKRLKRGADVYSTSKKRAKKLQKKTYGNKKAIHDKPHGKGYRPHYHNRKRKGGHSFY